MIVELYYILGIYLESGAMSCVVDKLTLDDKYFLLKENRNRLLVRASHFVYFSVLTSDNRIYMADRDVTSHVI
jgi:hypothetical protein